MKDELNPETGIGMSEIGEEVDYLIIGQGICGTFLSYYLLKGGKKVVVIDEDKLYTSSKVASGVINPVTGRRIVKTWRIDELLPFALEAYSNLEIELGVKLVKECSVLDFHPTQQMNEAFLKRTLEEPVLLQKGNKEEYADKFNFYYDVGIVNSCLLIDINSMLAAFKQMLVCQKILLNEVFYIEQLQLNNDGITYKNIKAKAIIFCDGVNGTENPYFKNLPYSLNKGEALIAQIPGLPGENVYKQGISIVPWKEDLFWVGSSYEWSFNNILPSPAFKTKVYNQLNSWLKIPFTIVDHIASVRPANMERRPFVGLHPKLSMVGILNGMGTKGCSLAPFFAKQLADFLIDRKPIDAEADVNRFARILERKMN